jgi:hypothetical protein
MELQPFYKRKRRTEPYELAINSMENWRLDRKELWVIKQKEKGGLSRWTTSMA